MNTASSHLEKYCVLRQANLLFALPASCVVEVSANPVIVPVPRADAVLAGIAHLRSEFLAVLDMAVLAEAGEPRLPEERQLLVVKSAQGTWGLFVDRALGLETLEVSNTRDSGDDEWSAAFIGSATIGNEVARILNPNALYRLAERLLARSWRQDGALVST